MDPHHQQRMKQPHPPKLPPYKLQAQAPRHAVATQKLPKSLPVSEQHEQKMVRRDSELSEVEYDIPIVDEVTKQRTAIYPPKESPHSKKKSLVVR